MEANLFGIQRALSDMILGTSDPIIPKINYKQGHISDLTFDGDNNRPLDATNKQFHENPNILQTSEIVEMAVRRSRDTLLFTTRRLIVIDPRGSKKIEYFSLPWYKVVAFAVHKAGKYKDLYSKLVIWTDIMYNYKTDDGGRDESEPEKSMLEFKFH
jgi:Bacterial PH domain